METFVNLLSVVMLFVLLAEVAGVLPVPIKFVGIAYFSIMAVVFVVSIAMFIKECRQDGRN